jgi:hypothetical protein
MIYVLPEYCAVFGCSSNAARATMMSKIGLVSKQISFACSPLQGSVSSKPSRPTTHSHAASKTLLRLDNVKFNSIRTCIHRPWRSEVVTLSTHTASLTMDPTRYFERTLFYDRSPAANEHYELSAEQVFDSDYSKTAIPVCVQSHHIIERGEVEDRSGWNSLKLREEGSACKAKESVQASGGDASDDVGDSCSVLSNASSTALSIAMDQRQADSGPPAYPGPPKLIFRTLEHSDIEAFAYRTRHDFRVFYLQQQTHSFSRLRISKSGFETLMQSCHVFPRFNEYVTGFGRKNRESEVGPPPLKFRPLYAANDSGYRAFGKLEVQFILFKCPRKLI